MDAFVPYDSPSPTHPSASHASSSSAGAMLYDDLVAKPSLGIGYSPGMPTTELGGANSLFADLDELELLMRQQQHHHQRRPPHISSPGHASDGTTSSGSNFASPDLRPASGDVPDLIPSGTSPRFGLGAHASTLFPSSSSSSSASPLRNSTTMAMPQSRNAFDPMLLSNGAGAARADEMDEVFGLGVNGPSVPPSWPSFATADDEPASSPYAGSASSPGAMHPAGNGGNTFFPFGGSPPFAPHNHHHHHHSHPMYRSDSNASSFSVSSSSDGGSLWGGGVNPHDVNAASVNSMPGTPAEQHAGGAGGPMLFNSAPLPGMTNATTWWHGSGSRSVDALADGLDVGMGLVDEDGNESTVRGAKERHHQREGIDAVFSPGSGVAIAPRSSSIDGPSGAGLSTSLPISTISRARARGAAAGGLRSSSRLSPRSSPMAQRPPIGAEPSMMGGTGGKDKGTSVARNLFGGIIDYSALPTKRSRGRRPVESRDVGLADANGELQHGYMQNVPGGSAFDPTLNPEAAAVGFCETTKTGKPKKIFVCRVTGCGKVFKRSEHLKRHVRSIHTDVKPFACPWPACTKLFNRHDNLNQHLRVHRTSDEGGHVLAGISVGSDGILRRDSTGAVVAPESLGLRNVEVANNASAAAVASVVY